MTLLPYIMFDGNCEEAIHFYAKVFKGEIKTLSFFDKAPTQDPASEKKGVMHAHLSGEGVELMASDEEKKELVHKKGGMVQLSISFNDAQQQKEVFNALSENAQVTMALQDTFWGASFGMLTDKFGVSWMFNYDKPGQK